MLIEEQNGNFAKPVLCAVFSYGLQIIKLKNKQNMNLASIQKVIKLTPIEGADLIETATVLGWEIVVKKGEYKVGDLCYIL